MTPKGPVIASAEFRLASTPFRQIWYDKGKRAVIYQVAFMAILGVLGYYLLFNIHANLKRQFITTGFGFLSKQSGFRITESLIPHPATRTYAHALMVGFIDTLEVSFIGIVLTVIVGTLVGIARLSRN